MSLTLSLPVRIAAVLGLVAALTIGGAFMLLGRKPQTAESQFVRHPAGVTKTTTAPSSAKTSTTPAGAAKQHAVATKPATKTTPAPVAAPKVHRTPAGEKAALKAGLPARLARALGQHAVVVAALYNPEAEVDGIAFAEAQAGASLAGAGFVGLNVLSKADVETLTKRLGLLPDPGFLVYTARDSTLRVKIDGFADKETVAQAAENAGAGA